MSFLNHYWSTYTAYIQDPILWLSFAPCLVLWLYFWNNKMFKETLFISLPFSLMATVLFWSKW